MAESKLYRALLAHIIENHTKLHPYMSLEHAKAAAETLEYRLTTGGLAKEVVSGLAEDFPADDQSYISAHKPL